MLLLVRRTSKTKIDQLLSLAKSLRTVDFLEQWPAKDDETVLLFLFRLPKVLKSQFN